MLRRLLSEWCFAEDAAAAVEPSLRVCRALGLWPFCPNGRLSLLLASYDCVLTIGMLFLFALPLYIFNCTHTCLLIYTITSGNIASILSACFSTIYMSFLKRISFSIFSDLQVIDAKFKHLGLPIQYSTFYLIHVIIVIFLAIGYMLYRAILYFYSPQKELLWFGLLYVPLLQLIPFIYIYLSTMPFVVLLSIIQKHFVYLKQQLEAKSTTMFYPVKIQKIEEIMCIYNDLCDVCDNIDMSYTGQIFWVMPAIFLNLSAHLYLVIHRISGMMEKVLFEDYFVCLTEMFWSISWMAFLWQVVSPCYGCQLKSKEFTKVLYNMTIEDKTKELATNEKLQLHLIMKREIKFTACGFFPLDNTLIHSMIAAATTYLVILIQFGPYSEKRT